MNLEQRLKQKRVVINTLPNEVNEKLEKGNKFVVVDQFFDAKYLPKGYTCVNMAYKDEPFKVVVPQSLLFYMANPGEGDSTDALDEIARFYDNAKDYEDELINEGKRNVQGASWATMAKNNYEVYLINKLVSGKFFKKDSEGEPLPEFENKVLTQLDVNDKYVEDRLKAIAAISLNLTSEEIEKQDIGSVLKHVTLRNKTEKITSADIMRVRCDCGSHYEIRESYIQRPNTTYDSVNKTKTTKELTVEGKNSKISEIEKEIKDYRAQKHDGKLGVHDDALIRKYTNLVYIAKKNPNAQLEITPPSVEYKNEVNEGN
jgi:hypothetical protein